MTGERKSLWIHNDEPASPPIHTGFWIHRVIVRSDEHHFHFPLKPPSGMFRNGPRAFELVASGQERCAVLQRPSKILRVRQFKSVSRPLFGQLDEVCNISD